MPTKRLPQPAGKPVGAIVSDVGEVAAKAKALKTKPSIKTKPSENIKAPLKKKLSAAALAERVSRAIERELNQIEHIVGGDDASVNQTEAERRARTLASLTKTLSEVVKLSQRKPERSKGKRKSADDDAIPRDLDEFRRELSRRLERMVEGAAGISDEGDAAG